MSSNNRWRVRASSAALAAAFAWALAQQPASASTSSYWFVGTNLVLSKTQSRAGEVAVAIDDAGLTRFLIKLNATVAYDPAQRLIIVTSGDRRVITFTLGDKAQRLKSFERRPKNLASGIAIRADS